MQTVFYNHGNHTTSQRQACCLWSVCSFCFFYSKQCSDESFCSFLGPVGIVVEGYDMIKEIEKLGSQSGKPSKAITIKSCGEVREK
jgi:hypothetical protein